MKQFDFRTSSYFSGPFKILGATLVFAGLVVMAVKLLLGGMITFVGIVILTTHYRLRIDMDNKTFFDYTWILWLKTGEKKAFADIDYIFIKISKVSQRVNSHVSTNTIHKRVYDSYLKFSDDDKIHLFTQDNRDVMLKKIRPIATSLQTRIIDYSEGEAQEIK